MSARTASELNPELSEWEIDVIVNDEHPVPVDPFVAGERSYGLATLVHERTRQRQNGSAVTEPDFGNVDPDS